MFGRYVQIGDEQVLVFCSPETPLSEVCRRAVRQFYILEEERAAGNEFIKASRAALHTGVQS